MKSPGAWTSASLLSIWRAPKTKVRCAQLASISLNESRSRVGQVYLFSICSFACAGARHQSDLGAGQLAGAVPILTLLASS